MRFLRLSAVFAVFAVCGFAVCGSVRKPSKYIQTKCGFCGFRFGLVRFAVLLLDWFGYDHPYLKPKLCFKHWMARNFG